MSKSLMVTFLLIGTMMTTIQARIDGQGSGFERYLKSAMHNLGQPDSCCDPTNCASCSSGVCVRIIDRSNFVSKDPCTLHLLCAIDCLASGATSGVCIKPFPCP